MYSLKLCVFIFTTLVSADIDRTDEGFHKNEFSVVTKGRVHRHGILMWLEQMSLPDCFEFCLRHLRCVNVNYNTHAQLCELSGLKFVDENADLNAYGWVNYATPDKVDGGFSAWRLVKTCSRDCGGGHMTYYRSCDNPKPRHGGADCVKNEVKTEQCNTQPCPIHGNWSSWVNITECSATCDNGTRTRQRNCSNPGPKYGGELCLRPSGVRALQETEDVVCNLRPCPVDGNWGSWSAITPCSKTCGWGTENYYRECNNPAPAHGGNLCEMTEWYDLALNETVPNNCHQVECPVNGSWSDWSSWGGWARSCNDSSRIRTRECTNPAPVGTGLTCEGDTTTEVENKTLVICPVHGSWGAWSPYTLCSATCNRGAKARYHVCNSPAPKFNGSECTKYDGSTGLNETRFDSCLLVVCPVNGSWSHWHSWYNARNCGNTTRSRNRYCNNPSQAGTGLPCNGSYSEVEDVVLKYCPVNGGYTEYGSWTECSTTCHYGAQKRSRACTNPPPLYGGICVGKSVETKHCNVYVKCTEDGVFGHWGNWGDWSGSCSKSCHYGQKYRYKSCDSPVPVGDGTYCYPKNKPGQSKVCNNGVQCMTVRQILAAPEWTSDKETKTSFLLCKRHQISFEIKLDKLNETAHVNVLSIGDMFWLDYIGSSFVLQVYEAKETFVIRPGDECKITFTSHRKKSKFSWNLKIELCKTQDFGWIEYAPRVQKDNKLTIPKIVGIYLRNFNIRGTNRAHRSTWHCHDDKDDLA